MKKLHLRRILLLMIICFISTGFLNAQNCTPSASNPDTDGDGIADVCDLDDDNDGILDMDEDCPFLAQNASGVWIGQTTSNATVTTNGLVPLNQASNIHDFQNRFYIGQNGAGECIDRSGDVDHRISFSSPVPANELAIYIDGLTPSISTSFVNIRIVVNGTTANNIFATAIPISNGSNYLNYDAATGHVTSSSSNAQSLMLKGVGNTLVSSVQIVSLGISPSDRLYYSFYGKKKLCDADNDGISNHLDLDSDDDGCPDAIEGAENVVSTQLNTSGAIATNAAGVMNVSNIASVNTNGVPLLVNSGGAADIGTSTVGSVGQPIGTSQIFNPQAVAGTASADQVIIAGTAPTDLTLTGHTGTIRWQVSTNNITFTNITPAATGTSYSPGALTATRYYRATLASAGGCTANTNVVTITVNQYCYENPGTSATTKPVKHGITVLGRAGKTGANGNANDWPMVRNSAYTALEGKTKGFVITRIANPETAITDPKIGMMVFDTDADSGKGCLKINTDGTSTGWKCFTKQSCP